MSPLFQIEKAISQNNYKLAINILEKKLLSETANDLYFYLLGKCYLQIKNYESSYNNFQKAVAINPYGAYKNEIYSIALNELAISGFIKSGRKKIILDMYDRESVHARALYPFADTYFIDNINKCDKPDYFIVANWLSPSHPVYEQIDTLQCPVVSMIVDRVIHSEEHIRANLIYSDIVFVMENYSVNLYEKQGFKNVFYLPCAGSVGYDPLIYPKLNLEKIYDVIFLGNTSNSPIYTKRRKILDKLEKLKYKYNILVKEVSNYDEYWILMNQSKIILDHTIDSQGLNYRMFQALGIETLCMVEENSMVSELYNDQEIVMYNENNFESLIEYHLKNDLERKTIAHNGYLKTINNYTHADMFKLVLDQLDKNRYILPSQKSDYTGQRLLLNKGITKHYQNKHSEALELFYQLDESIEKSNNIMVQLINICIKENQDLDKEIKDIFLNYPDDLIINFNYYLYLKFIKEITISDFAYILNLKSEYAGLIFLPVKNKYFYDNFKFGQGEIIFKYGIDSKDYIYQFNLLAKEFYSNFSYC